MRINTNICDIFQAITHENEVELNSLLRQSNQCLRVPFRGTTALSFAVYRGHLPSVVALLDQGAAVDQRSKDYLQRLETPLITSIRLGNYDIFRTLLQRGAKLNPKDFYGQSALWHAVKEQRISFVKDLLALGAPINFTEGTESPINLVTPYLCYKGRRALAIELIAAGLDVNFSRFDQTKPVVWAVHHRDLSMFCLLIEAGGEINKKEMDEIRLPKSWLAQAAQDEVFAPNTTLPLKKICRSVIRNHLRNTRNRDLRPLTASLPLPLSLIQFLLLTKYIETAKNFES